MAIKPLLDYVKEVSEGNASLKIGKALAAFAKLNTAEKEELRRFVQDVQDRGQDVILDFEENYPNLAKEPEVYDSLGDLIDAILSEDALGYINMFKS